MLKQYVDHIVRINQKKGKKNNLTRHKLSKRFLY